MDTLATGYNHDRKSRFLQIDAAKTHKNKMRGLRHANIKKIKADCRSSPL